jgi:hypothetical protein
MNIIILGFIAVLVCMIWWVLIDIRFYLKQIFKKLDN